MLISAPLDITAVTNPTLSFRHKQKLGLSYGTVDQLIVGYRTSENDNWHTLLNFTDATADWEDVTIALPEPSATYQIAFEGIGHDAEGVYVDDVRVGCGSNVGISEVDTEVVYGEVEYYDLLGRKMTGSRLCSGVYIMKIKSENGVVIKKIFKD